ncbi:MAG: GNAT family N-acetyltransferase [Gordonia sp. (in: high G+C Gram-positive bacteria)]|uniref:GNAT family N-acetyltransferase n=1 Tax=Gordonia sp. (in: high G+C Gram-positive bacteria) TaxID=84139 RepID=UPI003BB60913
MPSPASDLAVQRNFLHRGEAALILAVSVLFTLATLIWGYRVKRVCGGPPFDELGRSLRFPSGNRHAIVPCYSDLMSLWVGRGIDDHVFPYIHGGIDGAGNLYGGVVEYPVLSGVLMWLGAIGQHTDVGFFQQNAFIMAPFALAATILLAWMCRWWVLLWAATPPLVLYAFHNWELPVVFTSVAAVAMMAWGASADKTGQRRASLRTSAILASIILAIGFSLKIYPGLFVLPLAAYVLTHGEQVSTAARRAYDWVGAAWVVGAAVLTTLVIQVPFMIVGYEGWRAALEFQSNRKANIDTNTFWYWGVRFLVNRNDDIYNSLVSVLSPLLIIAAVGAAMYLAWRQYQRDGVFGWVAASFAVLAAFMLFHKVHSPQYTLWVLPFFVLLRVPWQAIAFYLFTDAALDLTIFRMFGIMNANDNMKWWVMGGVLIGVYGHVLLLIYFLLKGPSMQMREPLASFMRTALPPKPPLTRLADADAQAAWHWLGTPTLQRAGVTLRPLTIADSRELALIARNDPDLGQWFPGIPGNQRSAVDWITAAHDDPHRIAFAVIHDKTGMLVGTTSYYDVDAANQTLAIGYTYYTRPAHGTVINPAAKLMLLDYAFTEASAVRVVWHTHEENAQSRAAIAKLGATFEGLLRKHRRFPQDPTGWRTTAQYAMTDDEWALSRPALLERVD